MSKKLNYISLMIFVVLLSSCASTNIQSTQKNNNSKTISAKRKALEKYRMMRFVDWENYKKNVVKKKRKSTPLKPLSKEMLIEADQNFAYFCMKNRKHSKFVSKKNCLQFTEQVQISCKQKYERRIYPNFIKCIKSNLKF